MCAGLSAVWHLRHGADWQLLGCVRCTVADMGVVMGSSAVAVGSRAVGVAATPLENRDGKVL
jgi:hypothetical protein